MRAARTEVMMIRPRIINHPIYAIHLFNNLGFDDVAPLQAEMTESSDVEDMRRYLEDTLTLLRTADEPVALVKTQYVSCTPCNDMYHISSTHKL